MTSPATKKQEKASAVTTTTLVDVNGFPIMSDGMEYELTLTPTCARAGESFTATMKLPPNTSGGAFMPFYADGSWEQGKADLARDDGLVSYTWVARPIPGEGRLITNATDSAADKKGTKIVAFRVVEATKSC